MGLSLKKLFRFRGLSSAVSNVLTRAQLAGLAGMTFGGKRDLFKALGYSQDLRVEQYRSRYQRGGIAARVMEAMPKATWGTGPEIIEDEDPEVKTDFEQAILDLDKRLKLWAILRRADILAGIGRFGVVLIGAPGDFKDPLESLKAEEILYLSPWSEQDVGIDTFEEDTQNERFGLPLTYNFTRLTSNIKQVPRKVHWSRVLHIADGILDEQVLGTPRLEKVWNLFDDLEKVTGGGSEAYWLRVHPGFQLDVDKDTIMNQTDMDNLEKEVDEYCHDLRRFVRTRGTKMQALNTSVTAFAPNADALLTQIAGASEIPKRILVGSEAAHLASTQDRTNWHDRIDERRAQYAEPEIIRAFIDHLIELGALPEVDEYNVRWPVINNLDEREQAEVASTLAGLNSSAGETVVTASEIRDRILQLPPLPEVEDEEDLEDDEDEEELEPAAPALPPGTTIIMPGEPPPNGEPAPTDAAKILYKATRAYALARARDVDVEPDSQPWDDVHSAADRNRLAFQKAFANAVKAAKRETLTVKQIQMSLERDDAEGLLNMIDLAVNRFAKEAAENFPPLILKTMNSGGLAATSTAKTEGELTTLQIVLSFDITDPLAIAWAQEHSAALVGSVTNTTRQAIREAIAIGLEEGIAPRALARTLKNSIGLTPLQSKSLLKRSATLSDKQVAALSNKFLRQRAVTIARTETIAAANEGQRQLWLQSKANGLLTNEVREWIVTPDDRLCPICEPMEGQTTSLEGMFITGEGDQVQGPPAHVSCRCAVGLTTAKADKDAGIVA